MRIESSLVQLQGSSSKSVKEKEIEQLIYWEGSPDDAKSKHDINGGANGVGVDVDFSKEAEKMAKELADKKGAGEIKGADNDEAAAVDEKDKKKKLAELYSPYAKKDGKAHGIGKTGGWGVTVYSKEQMEVRLLEEFMRAFSGKKFKFKFAEDLQKLANLKPAQLPTATDALTSLSVDGGKNNKPVQQQGVGWGVSYERLYEREEHEKMSFNATGLVKTSDGKEIAFQLDVTMSRSLYERSYTSFQAGDAAMLDPLMINYAGPAADLTETKYSFDLDSDGKEDQISFAGQGSGFLALDKNGDGKINDGQELFGTSSGDGFKDLAAYDDDGNGWIDENDAVFDKLRIWGKDAKGNDKLLALGQVGIGALYLDSVKTNMDIVGSDGQQNGQVAATGVFLRENGLAGSMQHVDIVV